MEELIKEAIDGLNDASKRRAGYRKILLKYIRENIDSYPENGKKRALIKRISRTQLGNLADIDICITAKLIFDVLDVKEDSESNE